MSKPSFSPLSSSPHYHNPPCSIQGSSTSVIQSWWWPKALVHLTEELRKARLIRLQAGNGFLSLDVHHYVTYILYGLKSQWYKYQTYFQPIPKDTSLSVDRQRSWLGQAMPSSFLWIKLMAAPTHGIISSTV